MAAPQTTVNATGSKSNISGFVRESKNEMKKVTWPTKQELIGATVVVIIAVFFVAALIWGIDFVFAQLARLLLGV